MDKLFIFDEQGHLFNFNKTDIGNGDFAWTGDLFFEENSSGTFKNIGLYLMEEVAPFSLQQELSFKRLQQHNNFLNFSFNKARPNYDISNNSKDANYTYLQAVNSSYEWYTKSIYSKNIGHKFPKGAWLYLDLVG